MAWKVKTACSEPGCGKGSTQGGRCDEHRRSQQRYRSQQRVSPSRNGYGRAWAKISQTIRGEQPWCINYDTCGNPSQEVDHILPKEDGGTDDRENLQGLCKPCHSRKTMREQNARR